MGALEILMETRARKEIADQANQTQQANMLLDYALGQQQVRNQQRQIDISELTAQASIAKSGLKLGVDDAGNYTFAPDPEMQQAMQKPVYTVDASGNLTLQGNVPSKGIVKQLPLQPQDVADRTKARNDASLMAPTAEIKNNYSNIVNAETAIQKLEELANKVSSSGWQGVVDIQKGKVTRGESNPELMQYLKEVKANAAAVYRAYTGDTRLSDQDAAARAYPLLWDPTEGPKLKDISFSRIKDVVNARKQLYQRDYGLGSEAPSGNSLEVGQMFQGKKILAVRRKS